MPTSASRFRWSDQWAPGRVFELRSRSATKAPPCILVLTNEPYPSTLGHQAVQIDERGTRKHPRYGDRHAARYVPAHAFRPDILTARTVARRRFDLERFDAKDLELIRYGLDLDFNGRVGDHRCTRSSIPCISGVHWTIFWTKSYQWQWGLFRDPEFDELVRGAWHIESHCGGDWRFGRSSTLHGWATAHRSEGRLRRIETILRARHGHLERAAVEMVREVRDRGTVTFGRGHPGPAFYGPGTEIVQPRETVKPGYQPTRLWTTAAYA